MPWTIFLTLAGSITTAIYYDKYRTRQVKQKWCDAVSHLATETLPSHALPRKLTIYLAAPPGDGLRIAREHFHEYIKPVLVAAAMDWDVVEGRKEGDVRFKTAERIRRKRRRAGEGTGVVAEDDVEEEDKAAALKMLREKNGTLEWEGVNGDLVVGRHTWKEYVRGVHEGWLGPADAPKVLETSAEGGTPASDGQETIPTVDSPVHSSLVDAASATAVEVLTPAPDQMATSTSDSSDTTPEIIPESTPEEKPEEKPKPRQPPPYVTPLDYPSAALPRSLPEILGPAATVRFPHILGFFNTFTRTRRFFNRRQLADDVGREVAGAVLASHRSFATVAGTAHRSELDSSESTRAGENVPEQVEVLVREERDWLKSVWGERKEHEESLLKEAVVVDDRIGSRMRIFELSAENEARAKRIGDGVEKVAKAGEEES